MYNVQGSVEYGKRLYVIQVLRQHRGEVLTAIIKKNELIGAVGNIMKCFSNERMGLLLGQSQRRPKAEGSVRAFQLEGTILGKAENQKSCVWGDFEQLT